MRKHSLWFLLQTTLLMLCICTSFGQAAGQKNVPESVLFIGNSYTYFFNLPQHVALMAEAGGHEVITRQSTIGGSNLGQHWRGDHALRTMDLIRSGSFDAVVLQDHSMRALQAPDSLLIFGQAIAEEARKSGAVSYIYVTWSRAWDPFMQREITAQYRRLSEKVNATIVPVGPAWQKALQLRPDISLYIQDGSHPSPLGTYLTACVFYGIFTGQSPVGLPARLITTDQDGEKLYIAIHSEGDALFCQKVAYETISTFSKE